MSSLFDLVSVALFVAAATIFAVRFRHEDPPVGPYALIAVACAVCNIIGERGAGAVATALLTAAAFLLLHLASLPYADREGAPEPASPAGTRRARA